MDHPTKIVLMSQSQKDRRGAPHGEGSKAGYSFPRSLWLLGLAATVILLGFVASNAGSVRVSFHLFIPTLVALFLGSLWIGAVRNRDEGKNAAAFSAAVGALFLTGSGLTVARLGLWGPILVPVVVVAVWKLFARVEAGFPLRGLVTWLSASLVLINAWLTVGILTTHTGDQESGGAGRAVLASSNEHPDVIVIVMDEFASLDARPLSPKAMEALRSLRLNGFEVRDTMWSAYPLSVASIPAILSGNYPVGDGEVMDKHDTGQLGLITQGSHRLAQELRADGYRFTMVESGLWMSSCGGTVDVCVEAAWLDEAVGVIFERSVFRSWFRWIWGDEFPFSGLHSMAELSRIFTEIGKNGERDLVVAHVLLPHFPYLLEENCERTRRFTDEVLDQDQRADRYARQAGCVATWLHDQLVTVSNQPDAEPYVVVTGDHGTALRGQLAKPLSSWLPEDIGERFASFALFRLPPGCPTDPIVVSPQIVDVLLSCLAGSPAALDPRHYLMSPIGDPAVVQGSAELLETSSPVGFEEN